MKLEYCRSCGYQPGELTAYSFIRAGQGWDYHQGPVLFRFGDGRMLICWAAYDIQECSNDGVVVYSVSYDEGESWTEPRRTGMPTVEAMAKLLKLAGGGLLLVWNNQSSTSQRPPHPLVAAVSEDGGESWGAAKALADEVGLNQLSNSNLIQAADGRILVCTSHYRAQPPACSDLDMLVFDEVWLRG